MAESLWLPDYNASGQWLSTAIGGVTLLNTNASYSVPGVGSYPDWQPGGTNFDNALIQIGEHEVAHGLLLGDQGGVSGDIMSSWIYTASNPGGATNNQDGKASSTITPCDASEVKNNPSGPYLNNQPPTGPPGGGCVPTGPPPYPGACYTWNVQSCSWMFQGGCNSSPIVIDTDGRGFDLTSAERGILFDFAGDGKPIHIAWTARRSTNGWLALDRNGNGIIDSAKELFGNITAQPPSDNPNGFLALAEFDKLENGGNGDGVIDHQDAIWPNLLIWIDSNHDGVSQPEELHSLDDLGIHSIGLTYRESRRVDRYGNEFRFKGWLNPDKGDKVGRVIFDVILMTEKPSQ